MTIEHIPTNSVNRSGGCSVVILYETEDVFSRATSLCDRIMAEHWKDIDIHLGHWAFAKLVAPETTFKAAAESALADVLVVASTGEGEFSREFLQWTELLLAVRKNREGALVGLFPPGAGSASHDTQLHRLALRAGMDYLNRMPTAPGRCIPDQPGWCASRAQTFTGTLDEIIRREPNSTGG